MLARHGPQLTEAALEDMRFTEGVVSCWSRRWFHIGCSVQAGVKCCGAIV